jgi:hypothetical protein
MKNVIEIKIECKGEAVGTLGWFNAMMSKSEFVIKNTKKGTPAMFLRTPSQDGKFTNYWICEKWCKSENPEYYCMPGDDIICLYAESDGHYNCFSDYPLTPSCKTKVEEMINLAVEKYLEWWNNQ